MPASQTSEQLALKRCVACSGGGKRLSADQALELLNVLPGWRLVDDGRQIRKDWKAKNFVTGMEFLNKLAKLAEQEGHHPDLHLESYCHVWIALGTFAVGGLTENDSIMAAKIDKLVDAACLGEWKRG
jgi:4a-hydroxytetrahydrobiopterin dehydratase